MYPTRLDTPPPASRFRRPWSPLPFDPNPSQSSYDVRIFGADHEGPSQTRREPSDVSVEALDLADYARTLAHNQPRPRQAVTFQAYDSYPSSPASVRPLSHRDSYALPPVLSPSSSSSQSPSNSGASAVSHGRSPRSQRRPFSLPTPSLSHYPSVQSYPSYSSRSSAAHTYEPDDPLLTPPPSGPDEEIDIAQFPRFTRHWFNETKGNEPPIPLDADVFDPANVKYDPRLFPSVPRVYSPHLGSLASHTRDVGAVPWGSASSEGPLVAAATKEERLRMLEREFGKDVGKPDEEQRLVGSVDPQGRLITAGPKKRAATRWLECLLSLLAAVSGLYGALFVKNTTPPPPASKAPAYALYALSVISFFLTAYVFIIYPVCCAQRRSKPVGTPFTEGPSGMMVLPVGGNQQNGKKPKGKKGKGEGGEGVQVNLIMDPNMFRGNMPEDEEGEEEEEQSDSGYSVPGSHASSRRRRERRKGRTRRRSVFAGLALEAKWKKARTLLKWGAFVDVLMFFLWGAEFVFVLFGKRCPPGSFNGWCDGYNLASASACLLCLAFGFSIFFDVKDLHASNTSPRTRTSSP